MPSKVTDMAHEGNDTDNNEEEDNTGDSTTEDGTNHPHRGGGWATGPGYTAGYVGERGRGK